MLLLAHHEILAKVDWQEQVQGAMERGRSAICFDFVSQPNRAVIGERCLMQYPAAPHRKMLVFEETGAVVAAPTFSLPEAIGGPRNWQVHAAVDLE